MRLHSVDYCQSQSNNRGYNAPIRRARSERIPRRFVCAWCVCVYATGNNKVIALVKGRAMNLARPASPFIGSLRRCIPGDINSARVCARALPSSTDVYPTIIAAAKRSRSIQGCCSPFACLPSRAFQPAGASFEEQPHCDAIFSRDSDNSNVHASRSRTAPSKRVSLGTILLTVVEKQPPNFNRTIFACESLRPRPDLLA